MLKNLMAASLVMALAGCADVHVRMQDPKSGCGADRPFAEGGERATLWIRTSAEFRSAAEGIYRAAFLSLQQGISDRGWSAEPTQTRDFAGLPPAVVMDIDETVLENSAPQAQMLLKGTCPGDFEALWDAWIAERAAPAIPGAAAFIRAARESKDARGRSVRVFLITNRECKARAGAAAACPQQDDTIANLRALGLDTPTLEEDLMMKGERPEWPSEKLSRRQSIAHDYRIVLNVGDDLSDFIPDLRGNTLADREHARCRHRNYWGERWIVIPNPIYGSWQRAVGNDLGAALEVPPPPPDCDDASLAP